MTDVHAVGSTIAAAMPRAAWPLYLVGAVALVLTWVLRRALAGGLRSRIQRKRLMTPTEVAFWHVLLRALPDYAVSVQVSMGALLKPASGLSNSQWWSVRNTFGQKVVNFVVVDRTTGEAVAVVELDDYTHDRRRDAERDAMLARGGYPVLRFNAGDRASSSEVRDFFTDQMGLRALTSGLVHGAAR